MIHPIESVQIIAADLPEYYDECIKAGVVPLVSRPNGWTEIKGASDLVKAVDVTLQDPMYGEEEVSIKPNLVVSVAVYGSIEVS